MLRRYDTLLNDIQHNNKKNATLSILIFNSFAECHYAECHYAECCYAKFRYAECHYAECHYAECRYAKCRYAECHCAECLYAECHYAECSGAYTVGVRLGNPEGKMRLSQMHQVGFLAADGMSS